MTNSFLLQDTCTVQGTSITDVIIQPSEGWLDLSAFQDVVVNVAINGSSPASIHIQTAPARNDKLFTDLGSFNSSGKLVCQVSDSPATPLARWLRWKTTTNLGTWSITFRITVFAK